MKTLLTAKIDEFSNDSVANVGDTDFIRVIGFDNKRTAVDWNISVFHFYAVITCQRKFNDQTWLNHLFQI